MDAVQLDRDRHHPGGHGRRRAVAVPGNAAVLAAGDPFRHGRGRHRRRVLAVGHFRMPVAVGLAVPPTVLFSALGRQCLYALGNQLACRLPLDGRQLPRLAADQGQLKAVAAAVRAGGAVPGELGQSFLELLIAGRRHVERRQLRQRLLAPLQIRFPQLPPGLFRRDQPRPLFRRVHNRTSISTC